MNGRSRVRTLGVVIKEELRHLFRLTPSSRPWEMPVAATIALGGPLLMGVAYGRMDLGLVAMLGGLVFLSLPETPMQHRIRLMMTITFGMIGCYALGALMHFYAPTVIIMLTLLTAFANM